ncbi:hypothetical protein ACMD2_05742 [Ananas comosus]|uniref:Uncharacterized protein n=1 Tax=Ananas comosus TaxID=4615 RepID=A0A199VZ38_ANACO|nr:hypothetical protein ACMD2_05742 [Ananas comosus]
MGDGTVNVPLPRGPREQSHRPSPRGALLTPPPRKRPKKTW